MDQAKLAALTDIVGTLTEALQRSDAIKESMLGAKIDEALTCAIEAIARCAGPPPSLLQ